MADDDYGFGSDEEEEVIDPSTLAGELYASVQANDTEKTLSFLELTVPPEHVDEECKWSMLHWAAYHGNVSVMQALLKAGAAGPYKKALTIFRGEGTVGMSAGEDVPRVVPTGTPPVLMNTPLHKAAKGGHLRVCWLLLSAGYMLSDVDNVGNTPVHLAAAGGHRKVLNCFVEHGADVTVRNNFRFTALDMCTSDGCRGVLKKAAAKPPPTEEERVAIVESHLNSMNATEESVTSVDPADETVNLDELEDKIESAREFGISEEAIAIGLGIVKEMKLTKKLAVQIAELEKNAPVVTQSLYCDYVNVLKRTVREVEEMLVGDKEEGGEGGEGKEGEGKEGEGAGAGAGAGPETEGEEGAGNTALANMVQKADGLIRVSHSEYWLGVATKKVADIECATEASVKVMGKLKESITKAEMNGANEELIKAGVSVHEKLTAEVEIGRAMGGFPEVKLPVADMEPKEAKAYWLEEDPEKPVNVGHIEQTREWPLPPEDTGEYLWTHSTAFQSLLDAQARLEAAVASGDASSANAELAEKAKGMATEKAKDVALLQAKDDEDKAAQVAAAAKLAKKLKKGKKGKK
ncbi:hypothetical protein TeGR_g10654 [Tetraparma gracilis]|uniref:Uncharacterized protein n=1 Tax=Tetraparma gracilis TaxID=2962635 RepID=A0ABQ6MUQ1_9STRA|nr:hypothetical protein TeGR_g10654 [Tetraparma gracilis]